MKQLAMFVVCGLATAAFGADPAYRVAPTLGGPALGEVTPVPDQPVSATPAVVTGAPVELYCNVKYRDERNIAPCAVPMIVQVPDPCNPCCCVNVQICVPPCDCPCVKTSKCGRKVTYDYGKYRVQITSARNRVVVDYDD
jgi:hypothetical protein